MGTITNGGTIPPGPNGMFLAGRYRVVRPLGQGGMGSVWLAEDTKLDGYKVAIKMLPSILVNNKRAYAQVKAEALVSLKLSHPNIATVRAFEEENGNPFLVMDYIDGQTLDDYLAEKGKLSEDETIRLLKPVAAALDYAHTQGVVHRDVKPGNVVIRKDGTPFVLDFGIAREIQETMTRVTGKLSSGTLMYMSPEQLNGDAPKPAQDIYSFAAMAYECLKGEPPFSRGQVEFQILNKEPEPLPGGSALAKAILRGLAKTSVARPDDCMGVVVPSKSFVQQQSPASRPFPQQVVIPNEDLRFLPPNERHRYITNFEASSRARDDLARASISSQGASNAPEMKRERISDNPSPGHSSWRRTPCVSILLFLCGVMAVCFWLVQRSKRVDPTVDKEIVFLVDTTGSMDALDLTPKGCKYSKDTTRLSVVKHAIHDFIQQHAQTKIGIVGFAGRPQDYVGGLGVSPLEALSRVEIPQIETDKTGVVADKTAQMTAMGDGLVAAMNAFPGVSSRRRVVVLISDGVSNGGKISLPEAVNQAIDKNIFVYTIGIGAESRKTPIFAKDYFGRLTVEHLDTTFDPKGLKQIASSTGASYFTADSQEELVGALRSIAESLDELPLVPVERMKISGSMSSNILPNTCFQDDSFGTSGTECAKSTGGDVFKEMEKQMDEMHRQMTDAKTLQANRDLKDAREKGKKLFFAIEQSNTDRKSSGWPSIWPHLAGDDGLGDDQSDIAGKTFESSTKYFAALFDVENYKKGDWSPYVAGAGFDVLSLCGKEYKSGCFSSDNVNWMVIAGVTDEMDENFPVLVSANIEPSYLTLAKGRKDFGSEGNEIIPVGAEANRYGRMPWWDEAVIVIRKGGTADIIRKDECTMKTLFNAEVVEVPGSAGVRCLEPDAEMVRKEESRKRTGAERMTRARTGIDNIKAAVTMWMLSKNTSTPPNDLKVLVSASGNDAPLFDGEGALVDPWANDYRIEIKGKRFAIISNGPDGKPGTEDDIRSDKAAEVRSPSEIARNAVVQSLRAGMWIEKWETGKVMICGRKDRLKALEAQYAAANGGIRRTAFEILVAEFKSNPAIDSKSVKISAMSTLGHNDEILQCTVELKFK